MDWLAVDFGTSNTGVSVLQDGAPRLVALEDGAETMPTAVFLDFTEKRTLWGRAAVTALIEGREGRFMRALKSVLGTPLMQEKRQFFQERVTLVEITARFLAGVKERAEAETGRRFDAVLSGRPVRFHPDPDRDRRAEADLRAAYEMAGFERIEFLPEPEAAALSAGEAEGVGLVVDIGGGTSDFTLFRQSGEEVARLASHGIRVGGTDFDRSLSLGHVMPLFGKGSLLKAELGEKTHPAPAALFNGLASWEQIAFLYGPDTTRQVKQMRKLALEPEKFARLEEVISMELGHDVAFAVEDGKIAANAGDAEIDLSVVKPGLSAPLPGERLMLDLGPFADEIAEAARDTVSAGGMETVDVGRVVFVGGSSLLGVVSGAVARAMPGAELVFGRAFTAIADGLAIETARR
ncbi:Hsp70 family protein [Histidinibacterium aquaticum]|uniref:Hsp70 family protein n=1 Tax=Histidinibacterium aquaticum TaxID=2613962 RepID=A0A5J5GP58_9RHOB|nr:Hsp70 family protein [Histidinibacterium aquaticum]KAA9009847.1 Hsp70 family protein [Histidinibacterium aquaticum]